MVVYLVNFATNGFDIGFHDMEWAQQIQNKTAQQVGIRNIVSWNRAKLLTTEFYRLNKPILDCERGAGYWLWKPYIILQQLKLIDEGDIVIYLDSDISFVASPKPLLDICRDNEGFFFVELRSSNRLNRMWTKRDCFHYMGLDTPYYHDGYHTPSGLQIYEKKPHVLEFLEEVLHYTADARILTDEPNVCGKPNLPGFVEHRHDQSILTLLKLKYRIQGFRWPSEYGNHDKLLNYRVSGEFLVDGKYSDNPYLNSPYGTILASISDKSVHKKSKFRIGEKAVKFFKLLFPNV